MKRYFLVGILFILLSTGVYAEQLSPVVGFQGGEVVSADVLQQHESKGEVSNAYGSISQMSAFNIYTKTYKTEEYEMGLPASNEPILSDLLKKIEAQYLDSAYAGRISKVSYNVTFNQNGILSIFILGYGVIEPGGNAVPIMESFNYFGGHRFANAELISAEALNDDRVKALVKRKLEAVGIPWVTLKPETTVYFSHSADGGFEMVFSFFTNSSYDVLYSLSISDKELKSISYPPEEFVIALGKGLLGESLNQLQHTDVPRYVIDGKGAFTDLSALIPFYLNDRLMIPLRRVMEDVLYFEVSWNDEKRFVEVKKDGNSFGLSINSRDYYLSDGIVVKLEQMPLLVQSSTFVPLDFFSDLMGCNVSIGDGVLIVEFDTSLVSNQS